MIIGIDEAGRGASVGPVYAGCVLLPDDFNVALLDDSKSLTEKARNNARGAIMASSLYGIGFATHIEIDKVNILQATFLAMQRAFENMLKAAKDKNINIEGSEIIIDGNKLPPYFQKFTNDSLFMQETDNPYHLSANTMVKADSQIFAVMAASILAKTERDRIMYCCDKKWPEYHFAQHKGYVTPLHRKTIKKYGLSPIARKSFKIK